MSDLDAPFKPGMQLSYFDGERTHVGVVASCERGDEPWSWDVTFADGIQAPIMVPPPLADVQEMIDRLDREDRAKLRPWMLAHFDQNGDRQKKTHDR